HRGRADRALCARWKAARHSHRLRGDVCADRCAVDERPARVPLRVGGSVHLSMARTARSLPTRCIRGRLDQMTFVTVGNATQPFPRLILAVERLAAEGVLPHPILVQVGRNPWAGPESCQVVDFMPMEQFERAIAEADVLIGHAGAGTIIHALVAGRRPIVMPRKSTCGEVIDDHQLEFVGRLLESDLIYVAHDEDSLRASVRRALSENRGSSLDGGSRLVQVVARALTEVMPQ